MISKRTLFASRLDALQSAANEISVLAVTTIDMETKIQLRRIASSIDSQVLLLRRELESVANILEGYRMDLEDMKIERERGK
jgi:hypothetical protein